MEIPCRTEPKFIVKDFYLTPLEKDILRHFYFTNKEKNFKEYYVKCRNREESVDVIYKATFIETRTKIVKGIVIEEDSKVLMNVCVTSPVYRIEKSTFLEYIQFLGKADQYGNRQR